MCHLLITTLLTYAFLPFTLFFILHSFFSKSPNFGVSVYENIPVAAETGQRERGARMRSVGVIVTPTPDSGRCGQVWRHVEWLKKEVRWVDVRSIMLDMIGKRGGEREKWASGARAGRN